MTPSLDRQAILDAGFRDYTIEGDFVLSNFEPARRFLDAQGLTIDRKYNPAILDATIDRIGEVQAVAGLSWSPASLILGTQISARTAVPLLMVDPPQFPPVADALNEYPLRGPAPSLLNPKEPPRVAVISDVCVTGASLLWACRTLERYGFKPRPFSLLDRERGGKEALAKEGWELRTLEFESNLWPRERRDSVAPLDPALVRDQAQRLKRLYPQPPMTPLSSKTAEKAAWLTEKEQILDALAARYASYWRPVTRARLRHFLLQLRSVEEMEDMLTLLEKVDFHDQQTETAQLLKLIEIVHHETGHAPIVCPWGGPKDSASVVSYITGKGFDAAGLGSYRFLSVHDALKLISTEPDTPLVFVDDIVQLGNQSAAIVGQWFNKAEYGPPKFDRMVEPLDQSLQEILKRVSRAYLCVSIAFEEGKAEAESVAQSCGMRLEVRMSRSTSERTGCFDVTQNVLPAERVDRTKALCLEIGRQLLSDKTRWDDRKRELNALGYGNSQKLFVFTHNTPTATITCLWKAGIVWGTTWDPIFLRR